MRGLSCALIQEEKAQKGGCRTEVFDPSAGESFAKQTRTSAQRDENAAGGARASSERTRSTSRIHFVTAFTLQILPGVPNASLAFEAYE